MMRKKCLIGYFFTLYWSMLYHYKHLTYHSQAKFKEKLEAPKSLTLPLPSQARRQHGVIGFSRIVLFADFLFFHTT